MVLPARAPRANANSLRQPLRLVLRIAALAGLTTAFSGGVVRAAPSAEVTIVETAGLARRDEPVLVGIPFARGVLPAPPGDQLAVGGASGRILERWPDGSVRWLAVDFTASVPARGRGSRAFTFGTAAPRSTIRTTSTADGARAESPAGIAVSIPAQGPTLVRIEARGAAPVLVPWPTVRLDTKTLPAPAVDRVEIADGATPGELLVQARQADGLRHDVRVAVMAAQPWVRLRYTLTHMGDASYLHLSELSLTLPWRATRGEVGIDGKPVPLDFTPPARTHALVQHDAGAPELDGAPAGRRADGAARVSGGGRAWSAAVPWFREEYPKALGVSAEGIRVDLAATAEEPLFLGVGAAKTWEIWLAVHSESGTPPLVALGRAMTIPLRASVPPARVVESGALPYAITPATPGAARFLDRLRQEIDHYRARATAERWDDGPPGSCKLRTQEHMHVGFYGAFNWGDWNFPGFRDETKGCDAWGNLEYDLPLVLGLAWVATGEPETWTLFENATRHYRDVDVIHHWPRHMDRVGLNHPHKVRHFATDAPNTVDLGHVWLDGLLLHYRLTGEHRSRKAVVRMADALSSLTTRARNPRQFGWPMVALAAAFEATGDARYRTACLAFAEQAAKKFPPDPNAEWKMGVLAEGMMAAHRATGDAGVRRWLDEYGRLVLEPAPRARDPRLVIPAGYLFELSGDARFATLAQTTADALAPGSWGKTLASTGRIGFALLAPLARAPHDAIPAPAAPPPASAPGSPRSSPPRATPSPPAGR
jgi:hypothetical protein